MAALSGLLLFLIVCLPLHLAGIFMHELGHVVAARLCGWKPLLLRLGTGKVWAKFKFGDLEFGFAALPFSGFAIAVTTTAEFFRLRRVVFALAGPVATLAFIVALATAYSRLHSTSFAAIGFPVGVATFLQAVVLMSCLYPRWVQMDGRRIASDMLLAGMSVRMTGKDVENELAAHLTTAAATFIERGELERARSWIQEAVTSVGEAADVSVRMVWIHILLSLGRTEDAGRAKAALLQAADTGGASRVAILDSLACLPIFYGHHQMIGEGLQYIELAINEAPGDITLQGTKCSLLIESGRVEEGLQLLEKVEESTRSENDRAIVSYYRALAFARLRDQRKAQEFLRQAIRKYPECNVRNRITRLVFEPSA